MTRRNQFELVTASFNDKEKLVWASYSQFQQTVRTRKNQFELVSSNDKEKPVQCVTMKTRKNQFELVTASFNEKKKPVWASHSQFQQPGRTSLS